MLSHGGGIGQIQGLGSLPARPLAGSLELLLGGTRWLETRNTVTARQTQEPIWHWLAGPGRGGCGGGAECGALCTFTLTLQSQHWAQEREGARPGRGKAVLSGLLPVLFPFQLLLRPSPGQPEYKGGMSSSGFLQW